MNVTWIGTGSGEYEAVNAVSSCCGEKVYTPQIVPSEPTCWGCGRDCEPVTRDEYEAIAGERRHDDRVRSGEVYGL